MAPSHSFFYLLVIILARIPECCAKIAGWYPIVESLPAPVPAVLVQAGQAGAGNDSNISD
jgi:hypothetical protein